MAVRGYASRHDGDAGLAVWCWRGADVGADAWAAHLADVEDVRGWSDLPFRPSVVIELTDHAFIPSATQRRDLAERTAHPNYRPHIAVVTRNPAVRGVMQAFTWLQKRRPYEIQPFATLAEGIAWLEQQRGAALPKLREMRDAAVAALDADRPPAG